MLTIRHVPNGGGRERIVSVASVEFNTESSTLYGLDAEGKAVETCKGGHAYVMNELGKTVSIYNLKTKEQQS